MGGGSSRRRAAAALTCCTAVGLANPTQPGNVLPHCPFKTLTGWDCPGCGSTRMLYAILHCDLAGASVASLGVVVVLYAIAAVIGLAMSAGSSSSGY